MAKPKVGVVGAGIAGASCAGALAAAGWDVDVFEKASGAGGRLASRRLGAGWVTLGAPFISAWNEPFREQANEWSHKGWVAPLKGDILQGRADTGWTHTQLKDHYLPTIETSELIRHVLGQAKLHVDSRVIAVQPHVIIFEDGTIAEGYDHVICAVPGPQAIPLLEEVPDLRDRLAGVRYRPVWAFLMRWEGGPEADTIKFAHNLLDMAVRQSTADPSLWLVHSSYEFAETIVEGSEMDARTRAVAALMGLLGLSQQVEVAASHLWLYARSENPVGGRWLSDREFRVALIGDGIAGAGVERAWESGVQLAQAMLHSRD
jgi:renalase